MSDQPPQDDPTPDAALAARLTVRLSIRGRVQGVGYRWWFEGQARRYGLEGWVRNRRDGTVEALIAGTAAAVETVIRRAHAGPPAAWVDAVEVTTSADWPRDFPPADLPSGPGFRRKPTA
ncbi:acylphosphatase [Tistrella bauzanensis]|uniref:acylphosphatase n=1 Tax=Tistrella bauzanensis TaxID=657419 RepID=A0ABQ1IH58_9PROT|nr:acylphosphatase [Tistrella bauzanensis]GGB41314.1 acylphosphatase [Tistrella bauzanensis]